jgi:hypothetical protein
VVGGVERGYRERSVETEKWRQKNKNKKQR